MTIVESLPNSTFAPLYISEPTDESNVSNTKKRNLSQRLCVSLILISLITYAIIDSFTNQHVKDGAVIFLQWVEENLVAGVFACMGVYVVATGASRFVFFVFPTNRNKQPIFLITYLLFSVGLFSVLFIPGSILTLGMGFVFANAFGLGVGVALAVTSVFIGASLGATLAFLFGRYLLRDWVVGWTQKHTVFKAIDAALASKGFRIMVLLRLSPIIPFNAINYMAGITAMTLTDYIWAMIAMLPGVVLFVFIGASAGSLADSRNSGDNNTLRIVTIVLGIFFGVLGIALTSYYAKKELNKIIEKQESNVTEQDQHEDTSIRSHIA